MGRFVILVCATTLPLGAASEPTRPFLTKHCVACHNDKLRTGNLDLASAKGVAEDPDVWEKVLDKLRGGTMPPPALPQPSAAERATVTRAIEREFARTERSRKPDPGRVTARRLNRVEYNNTIRDLLGVDFRPADDFPADDEGYGFDNIGDVLSLSPVLLEKYLAAAGKIARAAVVADPPPQPTVERYKMETLRQTGTLQIRHRFPAEGEYELRIGLGGLRPDGSPDVVAGLFLDDRELQRFTVDPARGRLRNFEVRTTIEAGERPMRLAFLDDTFKPEENPIAPRDRYLMIEYLEIRGPFDPKPLPLTASHKRIFLCGHANGGHSSDCARQILGELARRAYRRPAAAHEVDSLARFVALAEAEGETFEQGIRLALQAALVSPHFLFRIERHPRPTDPAAVHPVSDFELASRLSYFLWSSMPDEALLRAASEQRLRKPAALDAEIRRMLADPKSRALVENFAGQWLQIRNLETVKPDPDRFAAFDNELRDAMRRETEMFFEGIVKEDRSVLEFIDARYSFLNERLARHYGIPGVQGSHFRRVALPAGPRGGVLTQASVLTVSSYPTRTSPVLRGKWLLDNILGAPPPPPPGDVPNLKEEAIGVSGTLRQQLEQHRARPDCAVCHSRMDVLGFGLENFDAIGAWRTFDGKFPVDSAGTLPGGKSFQGPAQLKSILAADREAFARCLTEKMLTYALGRGLDRRDRPAVYSISRRLAAGDYRFSRLVTEIAASLPFQMHRGDGTASKGAQK